MTTFDLMKLFNIRRSSLQQYLDRGIFKPSIRIADGQGTKNLFSERDAFQLFLFLKIQELRFQHKLASKLANKIIKKHEEFAEWEWDWILICKNSPTDAEIYDFYETIGPCPVDSLKYKWK